VNTEHLLTFLLLSTTAGFAPQSQHFRMLCVLESWQEEALCKPLRARVAVHAERFNDNKVFILPAPYVNVFHILLRINTIISL